MPWIFLTTAGMDTYLSSLSQDMAKEIFFRDRLFLDQAFEIAGEGGVTGSRADDDVLDTGAGGAIATRRLASSASEAATPDKMNCCSEITVWA